MDDGVRYIDYPAQYRALEAELTQALSEVFEAGDLIMRRQHDDFEARLAEFCGTRHAIGVSNCTDALRLVYAAAGIGPGDEVVTVSHTFVATVSPLHHLGARTVLVDIGDDHLMDPSAIESAITERTRMIVPVHLNGRVCDMTAIGAIAARHDVMVVEDAAQALGATLDGVRAGAFGLAAAFSFYPAKLLGALGDAGAVVTDDDDLAERVRLIRNHGRAPDGDITCWGYNCRMDNVQAAILGVKLTHLPDWLDRRREIAARYDARLRDLPDLRLPPPPNEGGRRHDVFQNYEIEADDRDALRKALDAAGIETMLPWSGKALHHMSGIGLEGVQLPHTDRCFERVLMLPMYAELTDTQVDTVCDAVRRHYGYSAEGTSAGSSRDDGQS